jgi:hypothetical protein
MEASDGDGDSSFPERSCDVESAGILVRLNADERNNPEIAVTPEAGVNKHRSGTPSISVARSGICGESRPKAGVPIGAYRDPSRYLIIDVK